MNSFTFDEGLCNIFTYCPSPDEIEQMNDDVANSLPVYILDKCTDIKTDIETDIETSIETDIETSIETDIETNIEKPSK